MADLNHTDGVRSESPAEYDTSEPLPDRGTLERRLQELQDTTWNAQAIVKSVEWVIREMLDSDNDPAHSLMRTLRTADALLNGVGSGLDSATLLAATKAQEVAHG